MSQKRRGCTQDGGILEKRRQSFPAGSRNGSEEKAALAEPEGEAFRCVEVEQRKGVGAETYRGVLALWGLVALE